MAYSCFVIDTFSDAHSCEYIWWISTPLTWDINTALKDKVADLERSLDDQALALRESNREKDVVMDRHSSCDAQIAGN